jgi:hypothetical protein
MWSAFSLGPEMSFLVPDDVVRSLGNGDRGLGLAVLAGTIGSHPLHGSRIDTETLTALGEGNARVGERILRRFIMDVRARGRHG